MNTVADTHLAIELSAAETVSKLRTVLRHPRSLARPVASWRPPTLALPAVGAAPPLTIALTRYRVGPVAKARVRGYGATREPAYLISARITDTTGPLRSDAALVAAEAWVRAAVSPAPISADEDTSRPPLAAVDTPHDGYGADAVHEITTSSAATFVWLVDRDFRPVPSPLSMFESFASAA